jgi:hypothetical protein
LPTWQTHTTSKDELEEVYGNTQNHDLRLNAEVSSPNTWQQCARLGGFNDGELITAKIAAYDASGNLSAFSDLVDGVASFGAPDGAPDPGNLSVVVVATNEVTLSWGPVTLPPAITVPADAVLDSGLKETVFVGLGDGIFEPREVETGWRAGDAWKS